jgi:hypothetical protein
MAAAGAGRRGRGGAGRGAQVGEGKPSPRVHPPTLRADARASVSAGRCSATSVALRQACGRSVVVAQKPSKLLGRVRFPSPACPSRGVAQSGSAPGWGPGGRRFKSCLPDTFVVRAQPGTRGNTKASEHGGKPAKALGFAGRRSLVFGVGALRRTPNGLSGLDAKGCPSCHEREGRVREHVPVGVGCAVGAEEMLDRLDCDDQPACEQDSGLAWRSKLSARTCPLGCSGSAGCLSSRTAKNVRVAAMTSPLDSIRAEINARLPVIRPTPQLEHHQ